MSNKSQEILFIGSGLDTDSDERFMELGDAPYRLHILHAEDGSNGVLTNMKGNHLAQYPLNKCHAYQVNGSYYNPTTRKAYYFVFSQPYDWSTSGDYEYDNHLLEFNEDTEQIVNVFTDDSNYFGLELAYPVHDCDMIGDNLYFNPRISEPKMINITMAKNYTTYANYSSLETYFYGNKVKFYGGIFLANTNVAVGETPSTHPSKWDRIGDSYQDETDLTSAFDNEFHYAFNVIRHIPVNRPTISFGSDTTRNSNNVLNKVFRFSHRYRYFDDTYSLFSAYSDVTLPQFTELYNGEIADATTTNNYIKVKVGLHSPALIKEIDIIFQEIGMKWKRAKLINREEQGLLDDVDYTYNFYNNDTAYEVVAESLLKEPFDSVPQTAATQELINKNILAYGRCKEGFDNIPKDEIEVSLTPELIEVSAASEFGVIKRNNISGGDISESYEYETIYESNGQDYYVVLLSYTNVLNLAPAFAAVVATDEYRATIDGITHTYILTAADVVSIDSFGAAIRDFLLSFYVSSGITYSAGEITVVMNEKAFAWSESIFYVPGTELAARTKLGGFKTGAWHPFCLFYYDGAMRRSTAQTSKENVDGTGWEIEGTTVYVPMLNEVSPTPLTTDHKWNINWEISHLPPDYARWWRWGYAGNSLCSWFIQYTISDIDTVAPWVTIDITTLQTLTAPTDGAWNAFPQSNISPYQFIKGDRVRFITEKSDGNAMGDLVEGVLDYEIVRFDDTTQLLYIQSIALGDLGEDTLIEIYRPKNTDVATEFFEFGELMPIVTDSGGIACHGGVVTANNQDYTLSQPVTGTFTYGDVYHIVRTPTKPFNAFAPTTGYFNESRWYSDFYDSDDWDRGRVGIESAINQRTLNIVRYSNQYLQNTRINGLSTFEALNYKETSDIYGDIVAMMEVGTTLKVYMQKKSASVLIGRQEYQDTNGNLTTASSDRVFGSVRYPENNFGTQWLESVTKNNRYTYGFDVYNAVMWRDSANGLFPISGRYEDAGGGTGDYKMATWFKEKSKALLESGIEYIKVLSVWDEKYKNLYVIFKDIVNDDNNETIVYHEPSNRWICFADLTKYGEYDVMLEPTYEIVHGFEGGLGYFFNDETRFAEFNFQTSGSVVKSMNSTSGVLGLTFVLYEPSVQIDANPEIPISEVLGLDFVLHDPTVAESFVYTVPTFLTWGSEFGEAVQETISIGAATGPYAGCSILSFPDWLILIHEGVVVQVGDLFDNNDTIIAYPLQNLTGVERTGSVVFAEPYGMTATVAITQAAWVQEPVFYLYVTGSSEFALYTDVARTIPMPSPAPAANITGAVGSTQLSATFYPYEVAVSPSTVDVRVYDNVGGSLLGSSTCAVFNDAMTTLTPINLSRAIVSTDVIMILIGNE